MCVVKSVLKTTLISLLICLAYFLILLLQYVKIKGKIKLTAHLEEFKGTLLCRGTPVEKHCSRQT